MATGIATAYDLTVGVIVDMSEAIYMISPHDSPMITGLDADGLSILSVDSATQKKFDWMDEETLGPRDTLDAAATTDQAVITIADTRERFSTGDVLRIVKSGVTDPELIRVTGYGTTADTLTVTRGVDSSTKIAYASGDVVIGLGTALDEGSDPEDARVRDRTERSNFTQIFGPTLIHLSGTEQVTHKYGVANEFAKQVFNRTLENVQSREQAFLYGTKFEDTSNKRRTTGGLDFFITTNVDTASTQLTVATIETQEQAIYDAGGIATRVMANPKSLADLNAVGDSDRVRQEIADPRRGRVPVMTIWTEFGEKTVVRNRWCAKEHAWLFSRENVTRRVLRSFRMERLGKTGDADKVQILAEEGLEVKGQTHAAKFVGLSY